MASTTLWSAPVRVAAQVSELGEVRVSGPVKVTVGVIPESRLLPSAPLVTIWDV